MSHAQPVLSERMERDLLERQKLNRTGKEEHSAREETIGIFRVDASRVHPRQIRRLREIVAYFDEAAVLRLLVPVATASFDISLRLLDYCCTNYAKKTRVVICEDGIAVHLFSLYKDWLRHYRRRCFDPFRRRERITFQNPCNTDERLDTTVAQLNFLRWADKYKVISYVRLNLHAIEQDMMHTLTESKKRRHVAHTDGTGGNESLEKMKRKRTELSKAPTSKCTVYLVPRNRVFGD